MGVSGSGKSAVARALAHRLGWPMVEGDDFHPQVNVEKMSAGFPLAVDDRLPWLELLAAWVAERHAAGESTVMACSALTRNLRDILRAAAPGTTFVHLVGDKGLLLTRMSAREHFMPITLLQSQLDTLQALGPDEDGIVVDVTPPVDQIVSTVLHSGRTGADDQ